LVEATGADNTVKSNIAFANGDGTATYDLSDGNGNCALNTWEKNKFGSSNPPCID